MAGSNTSTGNKRIARNTAFLYVRMVFVLLVSLYTTRVVLHVLGVVDYGINNVVAGFVSLFAFLNTSMTNGIQRFYNFKLGSEGPDSLKKVFNMALLIQGGLAVVIVALLETLGIWYLENEMVIPSDRMDAARWIFQFSVASLVMLVLQIPYSAAIMAHEKMDYYAFVSIFDSIAKLGIALIIPFIGKDKLITYGFLILLIAAANFVLYYGYARIKFKEIRIERGFDKDLLKSMVSFSGWNVFGTFAYMMKSQGLNLLLNAFFGPVVNAARGVSNQIMGAIQGFSANIVVSFRPQVVQSYAAGDRERVRKLFFSLSKISFILLYSISVPIVIDLSFILRLWLGSDIPEYTIPFTVLVLVNMVVSSLHTPLTQVVHAVGKMKVFQLTISIIICSILPISWVFLRFGAEPTTVYWVSFIVTIINQIVCVFVVRAIFPFSIREYLSKVILPCFIFVLLSPLLPLIVHHFMQESLVRLLTVLFVSVVSSASIIYALLLDEREQTVVRSFFKRKEL